MSWTLHHGDCLDPVTGLASLPDQSVDAAIFDPPFTEHVHEKIVTTGRAKGSKSVDLGFAAITQRQIEDIADQLARVVRRWVLAFCAVEQAHAWIGALGLEPMRHVRVGVWVKPNGMPQVTGDRPAQGYESIVMAHREGRMRWNGGGKSSVYTVPVEQANREHPTQKPIALMRALVEDFTDAGETILDPFAGSGTTGVAALTLGRKFIGWEMDAKHHATALRRIGETREQPSLLGPRGPKAKQQGLGL